MSITFTFNDIIFAAAAADGLALAICK